jgi:Ca2+-binding RTX toxin-like protein
MHCDQQQGSSGGGWVSQHSFVVSNTSHGYPQRSNSLFYGPYYGETAKEMYRLKMKGWPSIGPVRCGGEVASIIGSDSGEKIHGTKGDDIIATLGGDDSVAGKGGRDRICAGVGDDRVQGGGGEDRIDGGKGRDSCGNRSGGNKTRACESGGKKG